MIKSIYTNQTDLITDLMKLFKIERFDLDPTYSKGVFYRNLPEPTLKYDANPLFDFVKQADCRNLPMKDSSLKSIMFDPPFLATTGPSLEKDDESNKILKRFSVFKSEPELFQFYMDSLKEFHRILDDNGFLVFKIQDKVSSSTQYWSHVFLINEAEKIGFYTKDLFIYVKGSRMTPKWQTENQQHARKFHSYFIVFQKSNKKVRYI